MPDARAAVDESAIREQAYYFWEQDGRPMGRESEYWMRAVEVLTVASPKKAAKAATKIAAKPAAKLKAAASKTSAAPTKAGKASKPAAKPKKK